MVIDPKVRKRWPKYTLIIRSRKAAEDDFNLNLGEESIFTEWKFHGNKINLLIISGKLKGCGNNAKNKNCTIFYKKNTGIFIIYLFYNKLYLLIFFLNNNYFR